MRPTRVALGADVPRLAAHARRQWRWRRVVHRAAAAAAVAPDAWGLACNGGVCSSLPAFHVRPFHVSLCHPHLRRSSGLSTRGRVDASPAVSQVAFVVDSLNQMRDFVEDRRKYLMSQRDAANSDKERTVQLEQQRQVCGDRTRAKADVHRCIRSATAVHRCDVWYATGVSPEATGVLPHATG